MNVGRLFACHRQLKKLLTVQTWPTHPADPTSKVMVRFGGLMPNEASHDRVIIHGTPAVTEEQVWATFGGTTKDETFIIRLTVFTDVPGQDDETVLTRLSQVASVVESSLRDQNTGLPIGGFGMLDGNSCQMFWWGVTATSPVFDQGPEGVIGQVDMFIGFRGRI